MLSIRRNIVRTLLFATVADLAVSRKVANCEDEKYIAVKDGELNVDQLKFDHFVNEHYRKKYVVFNTSTHKSIFKILDARSHALSTNTFEGLDGSPCSLLQGPSGIGKSEMLMAFKEYCNVKYPNIIPVYITYSNMSSNDSLLIDHTVLDMVKKEMQQSFQIETLPTEFGILKGNQILESLEKHDKYILLLVDAFEELYRVQESADPKMQQMYRTCASTLGDLNWLGNQKTGRFAVVLCGSSVSCSLLITLDADRSQFPLQNHAPYPNETKYRTQRLRTSNLFTDLTQK
jgi:hypothetical protein